MKKFLLAGVAVAAIASGAQAADLGVPRGPIAAAVVAPVFSWNGVYIGLNAGVGFGRSRSYNEPLLGAGDGFDGGAAIPGGISNSPLGFVGGAQIGYNYQINNLVLGLEAEVGYLGLSRTTTIGVGDPGQNFAAVRYGAFGALTGRLGFAIDRALVYAKGGVAIAQIRNSAGDLDIGAIDPTDLTIRSGARVGWTVGAGLEYAITPNWTARVEYQFFDFGRWSSGNADGDVFSHRNQVHTVRLGVNYLFSTGPSAVVARY